MEARKTVPQQEKAAERKKDADELARSVATQTRGDLDLPDPETSEGWMRSDFGDLVEFIMHPNMDNAHNAAARAFHRLQGLCDLLTFHESELQVHGDDIAGIIEVNASILRHAFEMVWQKK